MHQPGARALCGVGPDADVPLDHPVLRAHLAMVLARLGDGSGPAGRVSRILLCAEPPVLDAGEITDKGYVNQRAVLDRRAGLVARLYQPDPEVITTIARPHGEDTTMSSPFVSEVAR